jgi:hypothetical protein
MEELETGIEGILINGVDFIKFRDDRVRPRKRPRRYPLAGPGYATRRRSDLLRR